MCGSRDSYTSDRSYLLFTEAAGMLWASARSVRMEKSKQRYALVDFSLIRVSLVKGKGGWRIGSVEATSNPFMEANERRARAGIQKVVKLLRRFLTGEEPQFNIYHDAVMALSCLALAEQDDATDLEDQFTLRTLYNLGYIAPQKDFMHIIESDDPWSIPMTLPSTAHRAIEKALSVSHL